MSEVLSLGAFLVAQFPICAGHNAELYVLCSVGNRERASIYALITLAGQGVIFVLSLWALHKYAGQPLRALFGPWLQFVNTYSPFLTVIATGALLYPYQFSLELNKMAHVQ